MAPHFTKRRKLSHDEEGLRDSSKLEGEEDSTPQSQSILKVHKVSSRVKMASLEAESNRHFQNTDLFQLQIQELLAEVQPSHGTRMQSLENVLEWLKSVIEAIPEREPLPASEAMRSLEARSHIKVPFPKQDLVNSANYTLSYRKPTQIKFVGSYALKTLTKATGSMAVDVSVSMPASIFQDKDFLNFRYFQKRSFYLACLVAGIQGAESKLQITYNHLNGNPLQPILIIRSPVGGQHDFSKSRCDICVLLEGPAKLFSISKLTPNRNCIRPQNDGEKEIYPHKAQIPTPFYNSSLSSDLAISLYCGLLETANTQFDSFKNTCLLGRVWLDQRGFTGSILMGGFGHFEWALLVAFLFRCGGPNGKNYLLPEYGSYQAFRAVLSFLATRDLVSSPLQLGYSSPTTAMPRIPMVLDGTTGVNLLYKMSTWSYKALRDEAANTIKTLNSSVFDRFNPTFILRTSNPLDRFDCVVCFNIGAMKMPQTPSLDYEPLLMHKTRHLHRTLSKGLGDRVNLVHICYLVEREWALGEPYHDQNSEGEVVVGLLLNQSSLDRTIDHGPAAESKQDAASFRDFWGDKAELRRFKDGGILESLVWSQNDSDGPVVHQIIKYLLNRHVLNPEDGITFPGDGFGKLISKSMHTSRPYLAPFQSIYSSFSVLEAHIRDIEDLPLHIRQISPASSQLRYTTVSLDGRNHNIHTVPSRAEVLIQFEGSGRWPDDLAAIQRTKVAFLLKIGQRLRQSVKGLVAKVGLEHDMGPLSNAAFLDVAYLQGQSFRIRIHSEREQVLLEAKTKSRTIGPQEQDAATTALMLYKRVFLHTPSHTQAVRTLCTRLPLLSPTIRLVKKWFAKHLLQPHFCDELIEMICIRVFKQPSPWTIPASLQSGFFRTLAFIARWDWRNEPLVVDFGDEMTSRDVEGINDRFASLRKLDPGMNKIALLAASNLDLEGLTWTQRGPSKVVAARMTALARALNDAIKEMGLKNLEPQRLFISSTADYDFVLHLRSRYIGDLASRKSTNQFKNLLAQGMHDDEQSPGSVALDFFNELQSLFSASALFFYNPLGGSIIAGLWLPHTGPRSWKVNLAYSTQPISESSNRDVEGLMTINKSAILHDISRLGGDLILRVEEISV